MAIYAKRQPDKVRSGWAKDIDGQGRFLQLDSESQRVSIYFVGAMGAHAQARKLSFMSASCRDSRPCARCGREFVICGDWNMAHKEIDLANWRSNRGKPGFTPEERDWLTRVFEQHGFVDVFRRLDPRPNRFTWWSNLAGARERNVGWRIDYHIATPGIAALARSSSIYTRRFFSDHAPLTIDYEYEL